MGRPTTIWLAPARTAAAGVAVRIWSSARSAGRIPGVTITQAAADRLLELREKLGYSTLSVWMNAGGQVPHERVLASMRLFAERVMPRLG
jgi:hypothetical protein